MLKCTIPFNVLRHLQDICSSWGAVWNCRLTKWMRLEGSSAHFNWLSFGGHLIQPHLFRAGYPEQGPVSISTKGDSTAPQEWVPVFSCVHMEFCAFKLVPSASFTVSGHCRNVWLPLSYSPPPSSRADIYTHGNSMERLEIFLPKLRIRQLFPPLRVLECMKNSQSISQWVTMSWTLRAGSRWKIHLLWVSEGV